MTFAASRYEEIGTVVAQEMHALGITTYDISKQSGLGPNRLMAIVKGYSEPRIGEARVFELLLGKPVNVLFEKWIDKREKALK